MNQKAKKIFYLPINNTDKYKSRRTKAYFKTENFNLFIMLPQMNLNK